MAADEAEMAQQASAHNHIICCTNTKKLGTFIQNQYRFQNNSEAPATTPGQSDKEWRQGRAGEGGVVKETEDQRAKETRRAEVASHGEARLQYGHRRCHGQQLGKRLCICQKRTQEFH